MDDMDSEIYEEIANELGIKSVDIENYIRARTPQRKRKFNYQDGTFIVGLGDFIPPMQNKEKPSSFLDLFKKQTTSSLSEDEWWKISSLHTKREWLQAYYFENKIGNTQNEIKICPVCNGVGKESLKKYVTIAKVSVTKESLYFNNNNIHFLIQYVTICYVL